MSEGKGAWTPGPWFTANTPDGRKCVMHDSGDICELGGTGNQQADACLIASAPDLYEALRRCGRDWAVAECLSAETITFAQAALARARGESPQ